MGGHNWGHWTHSKLCHWNFPVLVVCRRVAGQTQARESCNTSELFTTVGSDYEVPLDFFLKKIIKSLQKKARTPPWLPVVVCYSCMHMHTPSTCICTHTHRHIHKRDKRQGKWLTLLWSTEWTGCKDANLARQLELYIFFFPEKYLLQRMSPFNSIFFSCSGFD